MTIVEVEKLEARYFVLPPLDRLSVAAHIMGVNRARLDFGPNSAKAASVFYTDLKKAMEIVTK